MKIIVTVMMNTIIGKEHNEFTTMILVLTLHFIVNDKFYNEKG